MNELLMVLTLMVPAPDKAVSWTINEVPSQVQLLHKGGLEISYVATQVPCNAETQRVGFKRYDGDGSCYMVDLNYPVFYRHKDMWLSLTRRDK